MSNELFQTKKCPTRNELLDYLLGRLPDELLGQLESHFAACEQCEETLDGLGAEDTFSRLAEDAILEQATDDGEREFVSRLVTQLQGNERFRIQPRAVQERAAEIIRMLAPSNSPESLGRLANYRIERVLGAGSSGVVFYAVDESLDRPVALKVLRPSLGSVARQRFIVEARATASINHPQIVTIYQVGQENELAFIAMQWLPGETLESRLERVTFLPECEVRAIAGQIVLGLQAAHEKMLVHRDIKPANIWLCEKTGEAKILDFGLARIADEDPHLTSTGMLAGTPNFMSPEQTRGQELDGRTDLFSLGCLMYQAATGKLPFGEKGILATLQAIQHHHPRPAIELNPNLDGDFSDLVMCLLEKQPANRPSSAMEVAKALVQPRDSWAFRTTNYPVVTTSDISAVRFPKTQPGKPVLKRKTNRMRWVASFILVGLAAWGWSVFGQQIIRIATNHGEVVIESNDEDIRVEILKDGELIRVVDLKTEQKIEIKAGQYEIKAGTKGDDNSVSVSPNTLTMTRGGKQVVVISRRDPVLDSAGTVSANRNEPTYDGRTFDDWINQMRHEKSQKFVNEGAVAIGYLSREDDTKVKRALDWIRPLIREHGSEVIGGGSTWPGTFNEFFSQVKPSIIVGFAIEELESGTSQSREQMVWNFVLGSIHEGDSRGIVEHQQAIRDQFQLILDKGLKSIEDDRSKGESQQIRELLSCAIQSATQELESSPPSSTEMEWASGSGSKVKAMLEERLAASHNTETQAFLASELVGMESESRLAIQKFCELLADPVVPPDLTCQMYFNRLGFLDTEGILQVVPSLIDLYNSDEMCDRLGQFQRSSQLQRQLESGNSARRSTPPTLEAVRSSIRHSILVHLGNYGKAASDALPWLDELASHSSEVHGVVTLPHRAKKTASQIRGDLGPGGNAAAGGGDAAAGGGDAADERGVTVEANEPRPKPSTNESDPSQPANDKAGLSKPAESPVAKTLHGKTLAEWMLILKTELDRTTLLQACRSIGELADHDPESAIAAQSLVEWLESNPKLPADDPLRRDSDPEIERIFATAIESLGKIPWESSELDERAFATVLRVVRDVPVLKTGSHVGSSYQGGELLQDAIGNAACKFFARHLKPDQVIEFIEQQLVAGSDQSGFRLQHLYGEPEFVTTIKQVMPELIESINDWPAIAKLENQQSYTREFLRLGIFYFKNDEYKIAAESAMKELMGGKK